MKQQKQYKLNSLEETSELGIMLAQELKIGDIITITGDLGAGKTTLCQAIIKYFCGQDTYVTSPTFNLVQPYETPNFIIYHFDLYRLKHKEEIYDLALEDAWQFGISLIEWPEIILNMLPTKRIEINFSMGAEENQRLCNITYLS